MTDFVENEAADYCEGPLKQQCLDESGLYRWEDKHFRLHIQSGILEMFLKDNETKIDVTEPTLMSFVGAKHAKEWSISTPTIGSYGYDVVWDSGRIWSFLANDMATCRKWVQAINISITHNPVEVSRHPKEGKEETYVEENVAMELNPAELNEKWVLDSSSIATKPNTNLDIERSRDLDATHVETHTPGGINIHSHLATQATTEKYGTHHQVSNTQHRRPQQVQQQPEHEQLLNTNIRKSTTPSAHGNTVKFHPPGGYQANNEDDHSSDSDNISAIPLVPSSDGSPESCQQETSEEKKNIRRETSHMEPFRMSATAGFEYTHDGSTNATTSGNRDTNLPTVQKDYHRSHQDNAMMTEEKQQEQGNGKGGVEEPDDFEANQSDIKLLKRQQRLLDTHNEELQYDLDTTRQQLKDMKEDYSRRCQDLEWQLAQAQEAQVKSSVQHSHDVEQAVIRAQVDNQKLYEISSRSLKDQTRREVSCLQDELVDERKRYGTILLQERKMRSQADTKESELRMKYANLVEKQENLENQIENDSAEFRAAKMRWEREKNETERAHEARVQNLIEEKDQLLFETQETARKKVDNMTTNLNRSIKDMESTVQDSCRQAFQTEKMLALAAAEKRNNSEIEKVRQEERRKAEVDRNTMRNTFVKREQETVEDLHSLEQLHQEQCSRLENEVKMYQAVIRDNEMSWEDTKTENAKAEELMRRQTEAHLHTVREHVKRAENMELQLQQAHSEVQQARAEESKYREQLARALEESKIQRAEYISIQRQCENDAAMVNSWRTATKESELSLSSYETSLKIAREELLMVERNYTRVSDENTRLKEALQYADKVVYGTVPQNNVLHSLQLDNRLRVSTGGNHSENRKRINSNSKKKILGSGSHHHSWIPTYL